MKNLILLLLVASCSNKVVKKPVEPPLEVEEPKKEYVEIFKVRSSLKKMNELLPLANCLINSKEFKEEMHKVDQFGSTGVGGKLVYDQMMSHKPVTLRTYSKWHPFKPVFAYTYLNTKEIYINTRYYNRSWESLLNTVLHEHTHAIGWPHGSGDPIPWEVGKIAERTASACLE